MANAPTTPFDVALAFQRDAIRQAQRTIEQTLSAQRVMTEATWRTGLGVGQAATRTGVEASRNGMATSMGMMGVVAPWMASVDPEWMDETFAQMVHAQELAWRSAEEGVEDALSTYEVLTERGSDAVSESTDAVLSVHERAGRRASDAAVEYERQRREDHHAGREIDVEETPDTVNSAPESETAVEPELETGHEEAPAAGEREGRPESLGEEVDVELQDLSGVGSAYARRLRDAGIDSVVDLRDADVAALADETEIPDERLANWQRQAQDLLERRGE